MESRTPPVWRGLGIGEGSASAVRAAFPERGGLADALAQEVELCAAHLAVADDLDLLDARAVDLEGPLDPDARRDPADGDRAGDPATAETHDRPLEDLDALAIALDDLGRDLHGVTRGEFRQVGAELVLDDLVEHVHAAVPWRVGQPKLQVGRLEMAAKTGDRCGSIARASARTGSPTPISRARTRRLPRATSTARGRAPDRIRSVPSPSAGPPAAVRSVVVRRAAKPCSALP